MAMEGLPSPLQSRAQSIPASAWGRLAPQPSAAEAVAVETAADAALEAATVAIAVDAALAAPLAHAPTLSQMAADPSHPDLEAPSVAPAILNLEAKSRGAHLRPQAWPAQSAPEWRLRRYRRSTERAPLTEEPLRDPLERSSDNPDS
jgi:hypothetical protein